MAQLLSLQKKLGLSKSKSKKRKNRGRRKAGGYSYTSVSAPAVKNTVVRKRKEKQDTPTYRRTELLSSFVSAGPGTLSIWADFNPGDTSLFTWIPAIAKRFERYRWQYIKLKWVSAISTNGTGTITMAPSYDVLDEPITDPDKVIQSANSVQSPLWKTCDLSLRELTHDWLYVIDNPAKQKTVDLKTYTNAAVNVIIDHARSSGGLIGKLFVEYGVQFKNEVAVEDSSEEFSATITAKDDDVGGFLLGPLTDGHNDFTFHANEIGVNLNPNGDYRTFSIDRPGKYYFTMTGNDYASDMGYTDGQVEAISDNVAVDEIKEIVEDQYAEPQHGFAITCLIAVAHSLKPSLVKLASYGFDELISYSLRLVSTDIILPEAASPLFRMTNAQLRRRDCEHIFRLRFSQPKRKPFSYSQHLSNLHNEESWEDVTPNPPIESSVESRESGVKYTEIDVPFLPDTGEKEVEEEESDDYSNDYSAENLSFDEVRDEIKRYKSLKADASSLGPSSFSILEELERRIQLLRKQNRILNGSGE